MKARLLVDTDILVDFLRGRVEAVSFISEQAGRISLPAIAVAELYAGAREEELPRLQAFIESFPVVEVTHMIARQAGLFKNQYGRSHGLGLADALIAASAKNQDLELVTLNTRHYPMFAKLKAPYQKISP